MGRADNQDLVASLILRDQLSGPLAAAKGNLTATETSLGRLDATARAAGSSLGGLGSSLGQIAKVSATAFVAFKAFDFVADSLKAASAEETGIRQLTASLKANVEGFTGSTAAIEKVIEARKALAFSDDELRASLSDLVGATHDVDKAFDIQALALDSARFQNISLAEATDQLIKVQAGSLRVLKGLGIELAAGATASEAFGRIQAVVAGQADAFGTTSAAAFERARVAGEDFQEVIGAPLATAIGVVADEAAKAAKALAGFAADAGDLIDRAARLAKTVAEAGGQLPILGDALNFVGDAFHAARDPADQWMDSIKATAAASEAADDAFMAMAEASFAAGEANRKALDAQKDLTAEVKSALPALDDISGFILAQASAAYTAIAANLTLAASIRAVRAAAFPNGVSRGSQDAFETNGAIVGPDTFGSGGMSTQDLVAAQAAQKAAEDAARAADALRGRNKAADDAARNAKKGADDLAAAYRDQVSLAFDKAKRTADTLFDALHDRHIKAIKDAETLAEKQHDGALQAISDALKVAQAGNAAPVNAAEKALRDRQEAQQRRDLVESQQRAQQALEANRDPAQTADLQRSLRAATEALQNFDAQAAIDRLKVVQTGLDAKAQGVADLATKEADAKLAAAKDQAQKDLDRETIANAKRKADFDVALAALEKKDIAAGKSKSEIAADIAALEKKSGITIDPITGFSHIDDPLVTAIKNVKIEPPKVTVVNQQTFFLKIGASDLRLIAAALAANQSPTAAAGTRTGGAGRS